MKIKEIIHQHRRDFRAIYICEHCGHEETGSGYDDTFFHNTVIPGMKCGKCGQVAGTGYNPRTPKYPKEMQL